MENQTRTILQEFYNLGLYEQLDLNLNLVMVIVTSLTVGILGSQLYVIKRESIRENRLNSLKIMEEYHNDYLNKYATIINKSRTSSKFTDNELKKIEYLLNQLEILSIKIKYMDMDVKIVDEIAGNIIKNVMGNSEVKDVILKMQNQDSTNFERIVELHKKIINIKS